MSRAWFGAWCLVVSLSAAQAAMSSFDSAAFQEKLDEVRSSYGRITSADLTPDGQWFVYSVVRGDKRRSAPAPGRSSLFVVVRSTSESVERRYPAGEQGWGAEPLRISSSGRWMAFKKAVDLQGSREGVERRTIVELVEMATGKVAEYAGCNDFLFVGQDSGPEWIVLRDYPDAKEKVFGLTVLQLGIYNTQRFEAVREFFINPPATRMAWVDKGGLHEYHFASGQRRTLDQAAQEYRNLTWSEAGNALAALRKQSSGYALMTITGLKGRAMKKVFTPDGWADFPKGYEISPKATDNPDAFQAPQPVLSWRRDESGVFFNIRKAEPNEAQAGQTTPNLILWHWKDKMPPQDKAKPRREWQPPDNYLSVVSVADGRFMRLADSTLNRVYVHDRGRWLLGFQSQPLESSRIDYSDGKAFREMYYQDDCYLVDVKTGSRTLIIKGLWMPRVQEDPFLPVMLSPDGEVVLYQGNDGEHYSYQIAGGKRHALTAGLPHKFYFTEDLKIRKNRRYRASNAFQGWSRDGDYVLISDRHDVWALGLKGKPAMNLTGNGWQNGLVYERDLMPGPLRWRWNELEINPVELNQPVYFSVRNLRTGDRSLARWVPKDGTARLMHSEAAELSYLKAKRANVFLVERETTSEKDYYVLDINWRPSMRLTDINPGQRELRLREPPYLSYVMGEDEITHSRLRLPLDPELKPPYPTVVSIYEDASWSGYDSDLGNISIFPEHGYAVLTADIQPRIDEAGRAALEGVQAAVHAAVSSGMVDRERLGLMGHSMGGYETNFIVTQTDMFKAAVAESGMTDLVGECNRVLPHGMTASQRCATLQPYLTGLWWENLSAYTSNSPLYHAKNIHTPLLIVHGDKDDGVPFAQGMGLFNTLYLMGDKPAVLLQYVGELHTFSKATQPDISERELQFFNHFLKAEPAPKWWSDGLSYAQGEAPTR